MPKKTIAVEPADLFISSAPQPAAVDPAPDQQAPEKEELLIPAKSLRRNRVQAMLTDDLFSKLQKTAEKNHLSISETVTQILIKFYS